MKLQHTNFRFIALLLTAGALLPACGQEKATPESAESMQAAPDLDKGHVMSDDQILNAGIETTTAVAKSLTATLVLPAMATEDLDEQVHVNSVLPGVVIKVAAELGFEVERGALMCTIRSADLAEAAATVHAARSVLATSMHMQSRELEIHHRQVLLAIANQEREEAASERGFGTARDLAEAKIATQEAELARDRRSLELEQQIARQNSDLVSAIAKLNAWGFEESYVDSPESTIGEYSLFASAGGVVMERHVTQGESVDAQTQLFLIQGMEEVWMLASVFENQLRFVDEGATATVRFNAYPGMSIAGVVDHIHHDLDIDTRSVKARVKVKNHGVLDRIDQHPLLPGMYGSMEVVTGKVDAKVTVPVSGLLDSDNRSYLFTLDEEYGFRRRFVKIGLRTNTEVEILDGIEAGEQVVTAGIFILESLLKTDAIGEHSH
jgi:cobalt-zinc-cadmium efflux system membrane fusion protein